MFRVAGQTGAKVWGGAVTALVSGKYCEREGRESDIWTGRARRVKGSGSPPITSGGPTAEQQGLLGKRLVGGTIFRML